MTEVADDRRRGDADEMGDIVAAPSKADCRKHVARQADVDRPNENEREKIDDGEALGFQDDGLAGGGKDELTRQNIRGRHAEQVRQKNGDFEAHSIAEFIPARQIDERSKAASRQEAKKLSRHHRYAPLYGIVDCARHYPAIAHAFRDARGPRDNRSMYRRSGDPLRGSLPAGLLRRTLEGRRAARTAVALRDYRSGHRRKDEGLPA